MVDLGSWVEFASKVWEPSSKNKGLPFGAYLHASPPRRQRTLTGPLDLSQDSFWHKIQVFSTVEREQQTSVQSQCGFLQRLPLDIRMMIYDLVLGGMTFHMTTNESKSRVLSHICKRPDHISDGDMYHHDCFAYSDRRPSSAPREDHLQATGLLPLLVSCRRIYSEAIDTLYNANTFEFWENRVAWKFLKVMLPPQRLRSIRRFRWDIQIPFHPSATTQAQKDWSDLFTFFATNTSGLQHLYLKLNKSHPIEAVIEQTPDENAAGWIRPMVVMAVDADRKRGCKVEIVTNGVVHEPNVIFQAIRQAHTIKSYEYILGRTCVEMHRRIRLSLDAPG